MKLKKALSLMVSLSIAASEIAVASDRQVSTSSAQIPTAATYTDASGNTTTTTTAYQYNGPTIKDVGAKSASNNNWGMLLGIAGAGATGIGASHTCPDPDEAAMCAVYVAGLVASIGVTYNMLRARNQSENTVAAVTTDTDAKNLNSPPPVPDVPVVPPSVANDPSWQTAMDAKSKLEKSGWKFNTKAGTATSPSGKVVSSGIVSSPSSLAASGATPSMIKEYQDTMNKAAKTAEQKLKGTDSSDMFSDGAVGGGAPKVAASADGAVGLNTMPTGAQAKLGINRDPAQVAGMKKDYNGSPIGVAGDSLFDMVDRRYQLHQQNGGFISP